MMDGRSVCLSSEDNTVDLFAAIMRSFSLLQETIIPYIPSVITQLTQKLLAVSKVKKQAEQNVHFLTFSTVFRNTYVYVVICVLLECCLIFSG